MDTVEVWIVEVTAPGCRKIHVHECRALANPDYHRLIQLYGRGCVVLWEMTAPP